MVKSLENDQLKIQVKHHGAELCSLIKKATKTEYIWQADPAFWGRHAPVLFPIVGRLQNDQYQFDGQTYTMKQHGLARNMDFELIKENKAALTFELTSSAATLASYPLPFRLRIQYSLFGSLLMIGYEVFNPTITPLYFSIGGHPAFKCPLNTNEQRADYQLAFEHHETAATQRLDAGIRNGQTAPILKNQKILPITETLFDEDALVFKNLASEKVTLQKTPTHPVLTFDFKGFPYLGIWSKNRTAPFVCIEPWFGVADHMDHNQELTNKEGIIKLDGHKNFDCIYTVEIH